MSFNVRLFLLFFVGEACNYSGSLSLCLQISSGGGSVIINGWQWWHMLASIHCLPRVGHRDIVDPCMYIFEGLGSAWMILLMSVLLWWMQHNSWVAWAKGRAAISTWFYHHGVMCSIFINIYILGSSNSRKNFHKKRDGDTGLDSTWLSEHKEHRLPRTAFLFM